jgi:hypothetical protein
MAVEHGLGGIDFGPINRGEFGADSLTEVALEAGYALLEFRGVFIHSHV